MRLTKNFYKQHPRVKCGKDAAVIMKLVQCPSMGDSLLKRLFVVFCCRVSRYPKNQFLIDFEVLLLF